MLHPTLLIILSLYLGSHPATTAAQVYVKPSADTECPGKPCYTLDEYNENSTLKGLITDNTTMTFLPGNHNLSQEFIINDISNLTIGASEQDGVTITCHSHSFFLFKNSYGVQIGGLSFVDCGNLGIGSLWFLNVQDTSLQQLSIQPPSIMTKYADGVRGFSFWNVGGVNIHNVTINHTEAAVLAIDIQYSFGMDTNIGFSQFNGPLLKYNSDPHAQFSVFSIHNVVIEHAAIEPGTSVNGLIDLTLVNTSVLIDDSYFGDSVGPVMSIVGLNQGTVTLYNVTIKNITSPNLSMIININHFFNATFVGCEFHNNYGTPIRASDTTLHFYDTNTFQYNYAYDGGAIALYSNSHIYISNQSDTPNLVFRNNTAENFGGAVFVQQDNNYCFVEIQWKGGPNCNISSDCNCDCFTQFNMTFINNTAHKGGDAIYGANIEECTAGQGEPCSCYGRNLIKPSYMFMAFEPNTSSIIASDPVRVCPCTETGKTDCNTFTLHLTQYPGEEFHISAVGVGDLDNPVAGTVVARFSHDASAALGPSQDSQVINTPSCKQLKYSVLSEPGHVRLGLTVNYAHVQLGLTVNYTLIVLNVDVTLRDCPPGFMLSTGHHPLCNCTTILQENNIQCNISDQSVYRKNTEWVGASFKGNTSNGVVLCTHCPYGYCKEEMVHVNLSDPAGPDTQCAFHRSGTLCGACQPGRSLALGSHQCLQCSNANRNLSLILAFAAAGLALVFFIKILDLTVAVGTINGLIFYANIVQAAQDTFIPAGDTTPLTVFIAWLNLDLGIETCFFDGLDGYWKTWLQFVFPFYIWVIAILIIYLSRFDAAAKIFGDRSVQVLATLILLSYAKLLRTIITALSLSVLDYPDGTTTVVWSHDGNVRYCSGKHIPLFLAAAAFLLFLWLPYTAILLFEQPLQKIENQRFRQWMLKLKPFFDAYFGPFRGEHRYWVGILLLARGVLLLVFCLNITKNPSINLLAITTVVLLLVYFGSPPLSRNKDDIASKHFWCGIGGCYKRWYLSAWETSFLLNLMILSAATSYMMTSDGNQAAVVYTSIGIAFFQFICIVFIHIIKRFLNKKKPPDGEGVNREGYEAIEEPKKDWPPVAPYPHMDRCREPLLEYSSM